ncbi:Transmembrane osmosensor [Coemansia javaensis]|uniref:Transmembrane osmosensor n=1 Tax=Coemansia javaensis TaxID=2761396 RepID=A0A9W8HD37_9FUNG|nr:Transmembrane osmosensor [Coemansia javaensis]
MGFRLKRVFSSPVFFGTLLLILAGLAAAVVGACLKTPYIASTTWFMFAYIAVVEGALFAAITTSTLHKYRLALLSLISVGLSLNVAHIGTYINASVGALQALGAGLIFVEITLFFWVLVLGSGPGTYLADLCGTGADGRGNALPVAEVSMSRTNYRQTMGSVARSSTAAGANNGVSDYYASDLTQSMVSGKPADAPAVYKARALYAYDANPDDPNEVSIVKDETLLVIDDSGKWWQVKKEDGSVGIAPSNYLTRVMS